MIFYLKGLIGGRVVLSPVPPTPSEDLIQEIEAKHWVAAREQTRVSDSSRLPRDNAPAGWKNLVRGARE